MIKKIKTKPEIILNYKSLRKVNPEAARVAVLDYLSNNGGNILRAAKAFGIERAVVYNIIKRGQEGQLKDRSKRPHNLAHKTPLEVEERVVEVSSKTQMGPRMLSIHLRLKYGLIVPYGTIRNILRRNKAVKI